MALIKSDSHMPVLIATKALMMNPGLLVIAKYAVVLAQMRRHLHCRAVHAGHHALMYMYKNGEVRMLLSGWERSRTLPE